MPGSKKFVAQRTDELSQVLQELWTLRPELHKKNSLVVYLGVVALVDEARGNKKFMPSADELSESINASDPVIMPEIELDGTESSEPHPDSSWNF